MAHGEVLRKADYIGIQEHRLEGEGIDIAANKLIKEGWDGVLDAAYIKETQPGGGTAALAQDALGIRRWVGGEQSVRARSDILKGRLTTGIVDLLGGALLGVFYGLSGRPVSEQIPLWHALAVTIRGAGLPYIIMGDWQATPAELAASNLPDLIGGVIVAPNGATNTQSGRTIDYFLVAKGWRKFVSEVWIETSTRFATHLPVSIRIGGARSLGIARRVIQPKIHAVDLPSGPALAGIGVDWENWLNTETDGDVDKYKEMDKTEFEEVVEQWYCGAECELNTRFGHACKETETEYMGLGQGTREVECALGCRRRGAPDDTGIIGHRLCWAARGVHTVLLWAFDRPATSIRPDMLRLIKAYGYRATAVLQEKAIKEPPIAEHDIVQTLRRCLKLLSSLVRNVHGRPPLLQDGEQARLAATHQVFKNAEEELANAMGKLAEDRRARKLKTVKTWAATAGIRAAHAATKVRETVMAHSASASKSHLGEVTAQQAADKGVVEWCEHWNAVEEDQGDRILTQIEDMITRGPSARALTKEGRYEAVPLPPITDQSVLKAARKFKGDTGLGVDFLRPRHVAFLSTQARAALGRLLMTIEKRRRWPDLLRRITAIARAKKAGGSRLLGLAIGLYRIWARIRHDDTTEPIEIRLSRPFFTAAPGGGAERAAATAAVFCEAARARGEVSASTTVDIAKFYEQIEFAEIADGGLAIGMPEEIILLTIHAYAGPRRIRVDKAWSKPVYPQRSIVAGCTWATIHIRTLAIGPTEKIRCHS